MVLLVRCFLSVFFLLLVSASDLHVYPIADPTLDNTCSEGNVTQAYLVNGRSYLFHCPCKTKACEWTLNGQFYPSSTVTDIFRIETVTPEHSGQCLYCKNDDTDLYTVFNLTAGDLETMSFAVDDLEKNCSLDNRTKECNLKDLTYEYYDFDEHKSISNLVLSVSCNVTSGYPPFTSIQWNISDGLEDLSPCVFYTDKNQTLNINMDLYEDLYKIYTKSNWRIHPNYVTCVVDNGIDSLIGQRGIWMTHPIMTWFYNYPLLEQTSGVVTMDSGGYANVVCASHKLEIVGPSQQNYRICLVNYTHLGPSQRCSRGGIAPDMQCCNTRGSPNAHWCQNYTNPSDDDSIPVLNLTTSIEGKYQCQVWNPMMEAWQSIGDPVQVIVKNRTVISTEVPVNITEIRDDALSNRTTPFLYPFVAAVCLLCVLILLVIIFAIFIKCRRTKSHSTANYEESLRDNLLSAGVIGVTETELSVCTHSGPGIRCREVGQVPNGLVVAGIVGLKPNEDSPESEHTTRQDSLLEVDSVFSEETQVTADQLPKSTSEDRGRTSSSEGKLRIPSNFAQTIRDGSPQRRSCNNSTTKLHSISPNEHRHPTVYSPGEDMQIKVEMKESPLRRKVGQMTADIIHGMDVDALLLAALVSERLLTENQRQTLHSKLECSKPQMDINSYFLNVILLNWPYALFDRNLSKLSVILADHDSPGNQHLGESLHKLVEDDKE